MQGLIDHVALQRIVIDGDDLSVRRPPPRRIPGRASAHEQNDIGVVERLVIAHALIERMVGREVRVSVDAPVDHRDGKKIGELHQGGERLGVPPGGLGDDDRAFGIEQKLGDLRDVLLPRLHRGRRRHLARSGRGRPVVQHVLERDVQVDRPLGDALRHLAGAHDALIEGVRAGDGARPFCHRLDEALDAADGQAAVPLLLDIEIGIFAQGLGFTRHDDHRHFVLQGAMDAHASLQHADAGVQQDRLWPPGHQRVAGRHVDGERLMPGFNEGRPGLVVQLLARQRFPERRPLRARGGHDVIDLELAERLEDRLAPVDIVLHLCPRSLSCAAHTNTEFRRPASGADARNGRIRVARRASRKRSRPGAD